MILRSLDIRSFRCIRQLHVDFTDGLNVLYGPNELGKSTLVEALRAAFLLPVNSKVADDFVPWGTDETPEVVAEFETPPRESEDAAGTQPAVMCWRIRKSFGSGRNQSAVLEQVTGQGRPIEKARGRDVDGRLRELLDWGIQGPGGKGAPRGWPQSYLVTALLGEQDGVAKIFDTSLDADGADSGRNYLTAALGVLAQAPEVTALLDRLNLRTREAFTETGRKKSTQDSPLVKITDRKRSQQNLVDTLEAEERKSQEIESQIASLRQEQQQADADVARLEREVTLLTQTRGKRDSLKDCINRNAKLDEANVALTQADDELRNKKAERQQLESNLESAEQSHAETKQTLASHEARLKHLTGTRAETLESRQRQLEADQKTARQRVDNARRATAAANAVEQQCEVLADAVREVEAASNSRQQAARRLQQAHWKDVERAQADIATAESLTELARLTARRDELNERLKSAAAAEQEVDRLSQETKQADDKVSKLKIRQATLQRTRNKTLDAAKQVWEQRQNQANRRKELEHELQKAIAAEQRARGYLNALDSFNEVQQRLSDTQQKQLNLTEERDTSEQQYSALTDQLNVVTRSASVCLIMTVGCALGALLTLVLAIVMTSGRTALFSVSGGLTIALVVLALRWRGFLVRRNQLGAARESSSKALDRLTLQILNAESEVGAAQRDFDTSKRNLPDDLRTRFDTLADARVWLAEKLTVAAKTRANLELTLAEVGPSNSELDPEREETDLTETLDAELRELEGKIATADEAARTSRTRRDQAQARFEHARNAVTRDDQVEDGRAQVKRLNAQISECLAQLGWSASHPIPTVQEAAHDESQARQKLIAAEAAYESRKKALAAESPPETSGNDTADEQAGNSPVLSVEEAERQWGLARNRHNDAVDELKQQQASLKEKQGTAEQLAQELEKPAAEQFDEATQTLAVIETRLADLDADSDSSIESATNERDKAQKAATQQEEHVLKLKQKLKNIDKETGPLVAAREAAKTARDKAEENARQLDAGLITAELAQCEESLASEFPDLEISSQQLERSSNQQAFAQQEQERIRGSLHEARGKLKLSGGEALRENLESARAELDRLEAEAADQELEYEALRFLQQELQQASQKHSAHLGKSLARPVIDQFRGLTRGRYADLQLDPDLQLKTITSQQSERPQNSMSVGTRHQLATLIRLALAAHLRTAVVLDDQLVHSDTDRLLWFRDRLRQVVSENAFQAIIVTCRPLDYVTEQELVEAVQPGQASSRRVVNIVNLSVIIRQETPF